MNLAFVKLNVWKYFCRIVIIATDGDGVCQDNKKDCIFNRQRELFNHLFPEI
jgi:hypothetical protein